MSTEIRPSQQEELRAQLEETRAEPWLPIETQLVLWSIGLGIVLLGILVWLSYRLT